MSPEPELVVAASADELARHAAARAVARLTEALAQRPDAHLVVTGGGILEQTMRAIRDCPDRDRVEWDRVHLWWGDERFVPADSDERNDRAAFQALFDDLPLDPARIHRMPSTDSGFGEDVDAAAAAYSASLADAADADHSTAGVPNFDLVLLGIGPDGHCASLFPHHPGLHESAPAIAVRNAPKPPPTRLSLSFPALEAADEIWFIASGSGKADAVAQALGGADVEDVPSAGPRGRRRTLWLVDRDAAGKLPEEQVQDAAI